MATTMTVSETDRYLAKVVFALERSGTLHYRSRQAPEIDRAALVLSMRTPQLTAVPTFWGRNTTSGRYRPTGVSSTLRAMGDSPLQRILDTRRQETLKDSGDVYKTRGERMSLMRPMS
jgi:hypothetical protein